MCEWLRLSLWSVLSSISGYTACDCIHDTGFSRCTGWNFSWGRFGGTYDDVVKFGSDWNIQVGASGTRFRHRDKFSEGIGVWGMAAFVNTTYRIKKQEEGFVSQKQRYCAQVPLFAESGFRSVTGERTPTGIEGLRHFPESDELLRRC